MLHTRHFSRDEANALRPWVADQVRRLREARATLEASNLAPSLTAATALTGGSHPGPEHARAAVTYALVLDALRARDIVVRDLDRGLIDFPAVIDGHEGYLCWLLDEPEIGHWHGLGTGYTGRRPL